MLPISYARHQFSPVVIRHAVWLYLRFTLSYRDVEELLAERALEGTLFMNNRRFQLPAGPTAEARYATMQSDFTGLPDDRLDNLIANYWAVPTRSGDRHG